MVTSNMVAFDSSLDVWKRAIRRAQARPYAVEYLMCGEYAGVRTWFWKVSSNTTAGDWHSVSIGRAPDGTWDGCCDCEAGQRNIVCCHVALVLVMMGVLDVPDPDGAALIPVAPIEWPEAA